MMGRKVRAFSALVNVSLDDLVPQDHFYRHVERTLDLTFVRELVQSCYAPIGRPSVDPVVFSSSNSRCSLKGSARSVRSWRLPPIASA